MKRVRLGKTPRNVGEMEDYSGKFEKAVEASPPRGIYKIQPPSLQIYD